MKPEYTAYQFSPHARVACAGCHIGSGANYFVKSKITAPIRFIPFSSTNIPGPSKRRSKTCARLKGPASSATGRPVFRLPAENIRSRPDG